MINLAGESHLWGVVDCLDLDPEFGEVRGRRLVSNIAYEHGILDNRPKPTLLLRGVAYVFESMRTRRSWCGTNVVIYTSDGGVWTDS